MQCTESVTNMVEDFNISKNTVPSNTLHINFIVYKWELKIFLQFFSRISQPSS